MPPPLWFSPSLSEQFDLLGGERPTRVVELFARLVKDVFVIHGVTFIVNSLVTADRLAVAEFVVNAVKLVVLAHLVVEEVGVGAGIGEFDAGHFLCPFFGW